MWDLLRARRSLDAADVRFPDPATITDQDSKSGEGTGIPASSPLQDRLLAPGAFGGATTPTHAAKSVCVSVHLFSRTSLSVSLVVIVRVTAVHSSFMKLQLCISSGSSPGSGGNSFSGAVAVAGTAGSPLSTSVGPGGEVVLPSEIGVVSLSWHARYFFIQPVFFHLRCQRAFSNTNCFASNTPL